MMMNCPICNHKIDTFFLKAPALDTINSEYYKYIQCQKCDILVLSNKGLNQKTNVDYSNSGYYSRKRNKAKVVIQGFASYFSYRRLKIVSKFLEKSDLHGMNVLDIGCGKGGFLAVAKNKGAIVHGLEPTSRSFEIASNILDNSVKNQIMSKSLFNKNAMDIVTMWHVFEHIPEPLKILDDCKYVLKTNGLLIIAVPNYRGWIAKIGGAFWFNLDPPRHVIHYSEKALRRIVETTGFTVIEISHYYAELTYFSFLQTILNLLPINKNFLFNLIKNNRKALPDCRYNFILDALITGIVGSVTLPFVIVMTIILSAKRSSDCIILVAKKS